MEKGARTETSAYVTPLARLIEQRCLRWTENHVLALPHRHVCQLVNTDRNASGGINPQACCKTCESHGHQD
jgi:hypothetical protein